MPEEETSSSTGTMSSLAMEAMAERLSNLSLDTLYFPRSIQSSATTPSQRKSIFLDLVSRDPSIFLGRRAYLEKLVCEGEYFSDEAMREREPYLHREYVGKFQDVSGRGMARPGERWSETLMRRSEEARLVQKIRQEQMMLGVDKREWVGNEGEEEEEEMEEEEAEEIKQRGGEKPNGCSNCPGEEAMDHQVATSSSRCANGRSTEGAGPTLSEGEMQDQMDQFTYIMQQKFLSGEDHQDLDYSKIDEDETLDDRWLREANQDAEEKYFEED
ncbi:CCD97-like, C-terminal [Dillenia turbinata]|uniref:CCD97-like, C-terminal n=1 Tax=Dillenia turbinata TaxID=194707 RepID=A0AAN8VST1_9MAGN